MGKCEISGNLLAKLNGVNPTETIHTLQQLLESPDLARQAEVIDRIKKLTTFHDVGIRFWAKKLINNLGKYETQQTNTQGTTTSQELPVDILMQKLQSVASTYLSLSVIKKLCESKKPEVLNFLKNYLSDCKDVVQVSYLTKNIGINFPSEENLMFLLPYLKHEDDRIVANTIEGIKAIESPASVKAISQLLGHESNRVKSNAAIALVRYDQEKSFAVISEMLSPESEAHFKISACHAIKALKDPKFLGLLEPALYDDLTFSCALEAIAAIGGQPAITLLTNTRSRIPTNNQPQIDSTINRLVQSAEPSKKSSQTNSHSNTYVSIKEYGGKLYEKLKKCKETILPPKKN